MHPGDLEAAVELAWTSCLPTHDTQIAGAGAGAIAAGVSEALMPGASVFSVVDACLQGARLGEKIGRERGRISPMPSVVGRIETAVNEAIRATSLEDAIRRIGQTVGSSVLITESTAAAVGLFVAAKGDPLNSVVGGTNIGNDTDSTAAMAGQLAGALKGIKAVPADLVQILTEANEEDVPAMAESLTRIAWARL